MISSVTTTVSSVTTTTGLAASLGGIATLVLISALASKELAGATNHPRLQVFARTLDIAVVPLLVVFAAIVVSKITEVL